MYTIQKILNDLMQEKTLKNPRIERIKHWVFYHLRYTTRIQKRKKKG